MVEINFIQKKGSKGIFVLDTRRNSILENVIKGKLQLVL